jgi:Super-infection exclusion protein B
MGILEPIIAFLKDHLTVGFMLFLALFGAVFIFCPTALLCSLGVKQVATSYKWIFGVMFIAGMAYQVPFFVIPHTVAGIRKHVQKRKVKGALLQEGEGRAQICRFLREDTTSMLLWPWEKGVQRLLFDGVLVLLPDPPMKDGLTHYALSKLALECLSEIRPQLMSICSQRGTR